MKKLLLFLFVLLWLVTFAFAQPVSSPETGIISAASLGSAAKKEKPLIKLKPTQIKVLSDLDSARNIFAADIEKNKEAITTFNTLMQRSTSLNEQQKQAYDLIMESAGFDPKKYKVTGGDIKKGELTVEPK